MNVTDSLKRLTYLCELIPPLLDAIPELEFSFKPSSTKWSKKEILGHLIDSATNNHQRFIRIQYESKPIIFYDQNQWNALSNYDTLSTKHLIQFWTIYNQHLVQLIKATPVKNLNRIGLSREGQPFPLSFYIVDYVLHLEHHLTQLVSY